MELELELVVDSREKFPEFSSEINCTIKQLDIGDFIIKNKSKDSIIHLIERKTISDFSASIIDGRFREQRERMLSLNNNSTLDTKICIWYIFEECHKLVGNKLYYSMISAIINLQLVHGIKILFSKSKESTMDLIKSLYKRTQTQLKQTPELSSKTGESNLNFMAIQAKKEIKSDNLFVLQLCMINGVTVKKAKVIQEKYPTHYELMNAFKESGEFLLSDLKVDNRRLGLTLSKRISQSYGT